MNAQQSTDPAGRRRPRVTTRVSALVGACAVALSVSASTAAAENAAKSDPFGAQREVVERLHGALLEAMQSASQSSFAERREALRGVIIESFDFSFMAEKSAGRYWRDLDEGDRLALTAAISELAASNYAARFDAFDGERFETTGAGTANYQTVLVRTQIVQAGGTQTRLDYRIRDNRDGKPQIIDVFLNGTVSELAMRRAEYSSVIKREGFDALIAALRERVAALPISAQR